MPESDEDRGAKNAGTKKLVLRHPHESAILLLLPLNFDKAHL